MFPRDPFSEDRQHAIQLITKIIASIKLSHFYFFIQLSTLYNKSYNSDTIKIKNPATNNLIIDVNV